MKALSFAAMLGIAALSAQVALADDTGLSPLSSDLKKMSNKDGMISKKDFMAMMEKRFDAMDKAKKGMIHHDRGDEDFHRTSHKRIVRRGSNPQQV